MEQQEGRLNNLEEIKESQTPIERIEEALKNAKTKTVALLDLDQVELCAEATSLTIEKEYLRAVVKYQKEIINKLKNQIR